MKKRKTKTYYSSSDPPIRRGVEKSENSSSRRASLARTLNLKIGSTKFLLLLILLSAFFVRLWGINFGLPYKHIIDEEAIIYRAFFTASHNLQPLRYIYAPFVPYFLLIEFTPFFLIGFITGVYSTPADFFVSYLKDPSFLLLLGRLTSALSGVITVWLLWKIGKTFFNKRVGLLASFFLATMFLHVKESHYLKEDVLSTCFIIVAFYFALSLLKTGKTRNYIFAGIPLGLALATKYQTALFSPVVLLAHIIHQKGIGFRKILVFGVSLFIAYVIFNPYFILTFKESISGMLHESGFARVIYPEHLQGKSVWWWFVFVHLPQGMGIPLLITALLGFVVAFLKRKGHFFLVPLFPIIFFSTIDLWSKLHFARYAVMTLPFFALSGAIFLDFVGSKIKNESKRNILLAVLAVVFILPSFLRTVKFDSLLTKPDTRTIAKEWFELTISGGIKVLVESTLKPEYPSNFNVPLNLDGKSINKRIKDAEQRGLEALYLNSLLRVNRDKIGYNIVSTVQVDIKTDVFTDKKVYLKNVDEYIKSGVRYVILTSWIQEKMKPEFEKSLHEHYRLIKEFRPTYEFITDPHLIRVDYEALDRVNIFRKDIVFGPVIRIYQLKNDL